MTFREIINTGAGRFLETRQYEEAGLDVIENTPEEIRGLVVEMDARLNRTWRESKEDRELQERFQSLFESSELHGPIRAARIGSDFLRTNKELLE